MLAAGLLIGLLPPAVANATTADNPDAGKKADHSRIDSDNKSRKIGDDLQQVSKTSEQSQAGLQAFQSRMSQISQRVNR